ncbi:MAG TPA: acetoacetate decarboxylase family protein [Pseudonocardiaceae bacterium]
MDEQPSYPPEPWTLCGQAYVSVWRVPAERLSGPLPGGLQPLTVGGQVFVGTAWVDYEPEGLLPYHELVAAVLVRDGVRPIVTITEIWVDSPTSLAGGRALWGIPKELAQFEMTHQPSFTARADDEHGVIASADVQRGAGLPIRLPSWFTVVQEGGGPRGRQTPVHATGHPHTASANWKINPDGRLGYLHGLTPAVTFALRDFRMRFGS